MSELVLIALLPQGMSYIGGGKKKKSSTLTVPFSLPTPTAKHTSSQQCSANIPAQVQLSACCSSGIAANSKLNFQGTEVTILLFQWNRLVDFHSSIYMSTCHRRVVFWPTLQGHSSFTMLVQEEEKSTAKTWSSEQSIFGTSNSSNITTEGRNTLLLEKGLLQATKARKPNRSP